MKKVKYSNDTYNLNMSVIKEIRVKITQILFHLFNRSLSEGIFPIALKKAKVIPLFKDGVRSKPEHYRPISLLPQFSKLLEKLIKVRILKFLNKFNIISDTQYGFRKNVSTSDALSDVIETVNLNLEHLNNCAIVSIDLCKVDLKLLESYLKDRQQYVSFIYTTSNINNIACGVPQGSVLGQLLFVLYINILPNISNSFKPVLFADDTNLIFSDKSITALKTNIQRNLNKLFDWLNINKLSLNVSKSSLLLFNIRNKNNNVKLNVNINDIKIKQVKNLKFLGIIIDDKLDWKSQINYVSTKLSIAIGILNKVKFKLNLKSLVYVYNSFFYSHLTYCCHIWGNTFFSNLNKICILQKRALKIINNDSNYSTFYIIHKSLQFHDIVKMNTIKFMFRARNNVLPINLQKLYSIKLHNTYLFHRLKVRTDRKS